MSLRDSLVFVKLNFPEKPDSSSTNVRLEQEAPIKEDKGVQPLSRSLTGANLNMPSAE